MQMWVILLNQLTFKSVKGRGRIAGFSFIEKGFKSHVKALMSM